VKEKIITVVHQKQKMPSKWQLSFNPEKRAHEKISIGQS
jgi:hypothetical protein